MRKGGTALKDSNRETTRTRRRTTLGNADHGTSAGRAGHLKVESAGFGLSLRQGILFHLFQCLAQPFTGTLSIHIQCRLVKAHHFPMRQRRQRFLHCVREQRPLDISLHEPVEARHPRGLRANQTDILVEDGREHQGVIRVGDDPVGIHKRADELFRAGGHPEANRGKESAWKHFEVADKGRLAAWNQRGVLR